VETRRHDDTRDEAEELLAALRAFARLASYTRGYGGEQEKCMDDVAMFLNSARQRLTNFVAMRDAMP
jgi:hypothetical protein